MSWLFSRALVGEYSDLSCLDGAQSVQSKKSRTADQFCVKGKTKEYSNLSQFGTTCGHLTESHGEALLTLYLGDSHAKIFHAQELETGLTEQDLDCGKKCGESLAKYDQDSSSWRTAQCSLFGGLSEYLETWPRWGTTVHGELFQVATSVPQLKENEFLLPAPTKSMGKRGWGISNQKARYSKRVEENARRYGYKPHPSILEWSMGWIVTWTRLAPLATGKYRRWYASHGTSCAKELGKKNEN